MMPCSIEPRLRGTGVRLSLKDIARLDVARASRVLLRDADLDARFDLRASPEIIGCQALFFPTDRGVLGVIGLANTPDPSSILGEDFGSLPGIDGLDRSHMFGDLLNSLFGDGGFFGGPFGEDRPGGIGDVPDLGDFGDFGGDDLNGIGNGDGDRGPSIDMDSWLSQVGGNGKKGGVASPKDRAMWGMDGEDSGVVNEYDADAVYIGEADDWTPTSETDDAGTAAGNDAADAGVPGNQSSDAGTLLPGGAGTEPATRQGDSDLAADATIAAGGLGMVAATAAGVGATTTGGVVAAGAGILAGAATVCAGIFSHHTPNPEDEGSGRVHGPPVFDWNVGLHGDLLLHRHRVRVIGEWDAGNSYGWMHFGSPRASSGVMPSDDGGDERTPAPSVPTKSAFAVSFTTGGGQDDWWFISRGWGWSRFGAPRARH
jgi:hypothetical protein